MSHSHEPPGLPEVTDEAGDSPHWLPLLGLALAAALLLVMAVGRAVGGPDDEPAAEDTAAAEEAPAAEPAPVIGDDGEAH